MHKRLKYIAPLIIVILIVICVGVSVFKQNKYNITKSYDEVLDEANRLYEQGDVNTAIETLETYCTYVITDTEARAMLGDWYYEIGNETAAYENYYMSASNKSISSDDGSLCVKNTQEIIVDPLTRVRFEITPDVRMTKDMQLVITGRNIAPLSRKEGRIVYDEARLDEDENYLTTEWFDVDPDGQYLTMSGGFNCATWQFRDEAGVLIATAESPNNYRLNDTYSINVYQMARVVIPDDATQCRVTYFNKNKESVTASLDEELTIVYGRLPGESCKSDFSSFHIPDLKEGEKIVYDENGWRLITPEGETKLTDWELPTVEKGSYLSISGTLPGRVSFENCEYSTFADEGIYTIRFDNQSSSAVGERLDDAKNLGFNSAVGNGLITLGENHFDNIYPWKDMKLCSIKDGKIYYSGEEGFFTDGGSGDVFVEIPKFYVKRTVDEQYDTISISGVKHEGFHVDPAFVTEDGEKDKIYIAAYHTGEDENGNVVSVSGKAPVLDMTPSEIKEATTEKGEGYYEIDYAAIGAVQKLFMVETGLRNSQYLYTGVCAYSMASESKDDCILALNTKNNTNCIDIQTDNSFIEGNTVVIFDADNYDLTYQAAVSFEREITTVIDNKDGTSSVYFSGDPMDITEGKTAIAHVAIKNGKSKSVNGHTGAVSTARGTVSFKYRNIENLWGNAYVYVDGVTVKNGVATIKGRNGESFELAYQLPFGGVNSPLKNMIKQLGYDPLHADILLPEKVGEGATTSTYYGDAYMHGMEDKEYVLHYGGSWNTQGCAGLFAFATFATEDEVHMNTSGRMMFIK